MGFLPLGRVTRSHVSFLFKDDISSSMAFYYNLPYVESIASFTILGSSSMADNEKAERKLGGLYLSGCRGARLDLQTTGICGSTYSTDSVKSSESCFSSFHSNSSFSGSFSHILFNCWMDDLALGWKGSLDRTSESRVWMDGEGRTLKARIKLLA